MVPALRRLAARINAEWKKAGTRPRDLPRIATRLLADARPDRDFDLAALADWTVSCERFPAACNPFGLYGPSAFTVWSNPRLFVSVYLYKTPEVEVHDHDFAGAFLNLSGRTLHCTFQFADDERVDARVRTGELRLAAAELIREGDACGIEPGSRFIHQVWHLDQPTVVLVVRTPPRTVSTLRQFQYLRPALAMETFREDWRFVAVPARYRYTRKMAECLRDTPQGLEYVRLLIRNEAPWDAMSHLLENWRYLRSHGVLDETLALGAKHHGAWFSQMADAGNEVDLFYSVRWWRVVRPDDRILLALLLTQRSWPAIRDTFRRLLPDGEPEERIAESLARLAGEETIPLRLSADARASLAAALRGEAEWPAALRDAMLLRPLMHSA